MIFWLLLIITAIIVLTLLWWYSNPPIQSTSITSHTGSDKSSNLSSDSSDSPVYPTIHARCQSSSSCGGDLVCDLNCHRCKKKLGGDCSNDLDCESDLHCHNWKCISDPPSSLIDVSSPKKHSSKGVKWNDDLNQTFYI